MFGRYINRRELITTAVCSGGFFMVGARKRSPGTRFGFTTYEWGKDWDIPTLIANCRKAEAFGLELRTQLNYAHGVEEGISAERRREVKKIFADSDVTLVGLASDERFDSPDPQVLAAAIEKAKGFIKLSHDVGGTGVRVFPNNYQKDVSRETTIEQIVRSLKQLGPFARDYGQEVRLEAHGSVGELPVMRQIMERVDEPNVRVKLNSWPRDTEGQGFEANFNLVKPYLGQTLHLHELNTGNFPYELQMKLLLKMGWTGWQLMEGIGVVPDRLAALIEQRRIWDHIKLAAQRGAST